MKIKGEELLELVVNETGLPSESLYLELERLIDTAGMDAKTITLTDLRTLLVDYLQDVMLEAKQKS